MPECTSSMYPSASCPIPSPETYPPGVRPVPASPSPRGRGPTSGGLTAVDGEAGARDVARPLAGEVGDHARDVRALAVAAQRGHGALPVGRRALGRVHRGVDRPGMNQVGGDATLAQLAGQRLRAPGP